jgi:hypothetical protein
MPGPVGVFKARATHAEWASSGLLGILGNKPSSGLKNCGAVPLNAHDRRHIFREFLIEGYGDIYRRKQNKPRFVYAMIQSAHPLRRTFAPPVSRRYLIGWITVAVVVVIDILWLRASGHSVRSEGLSAVFKAASIMLGLAIGLEVLARIPRYSQATSTFRYRQVSVTSAWLTMLLCFSAATCVLSYLCVAVDAPLIDDSLLRFDSALGFNWLAVYHWVHSHPDLQWALQLAYESGALQMIAVPIFLGLSGRSKELGDFVLIIMATSILMLIVSTPFPSSSAFLHFGITDANTVSVVSQFEILRNGTMRIFDLQHAQGLVSMPSFHVALAVVFCYVLRHVRRLFPFTVLLNVAMIVSTPTQGAHYLADVFGGLLLACVTIRVFAAADRNVAFRVASARQSFRGFRSTSGEAN